MNDNTSTANEPLCTITPLPGVGERRTYRGLSQPFVAHEHGHYVIGLVKEGNRDLLCNGNLFTVSPGDMIILNPGDVHSCAQTDGAHFAYDSIAIDRALFDSVKLHGPKSTDPAAIELLHDCFTHINANEHDNLLESLYLLSEALTETQSTDQDHNVHDEAAQHVFARFCGNLSETPNLEDLAQAEGLSSYALIRAYRKRFSITPMQHLASLRIECACELLAQGVDPAFVAAETGFADQAHLTRVFKQRVGTTPAAYRKMTAKQDRP